MNQGCMYKLDKSHKIGERAELIKNTYNPII
jgi:hypothetical protein